jgi:hypothetical protein
MIRHFNLVALLFAIAVPIVVHGCADGFVINNASLCNPRTIHACTCNIGAPGQQLCHDDGRDYSPCECLDGGVSSGDGGMSGDAGFDATVANESALLHER